ncbi:hypothetical protein LZ198_40550 [Myxococcus sp. K15C18031901]|uniref:hypothetical protein n=1 Tax=Myxococcus dinghuensis TaxID=2906761 RepID=UPI0020A833CE|nr:hypothetical protein [Myxococcus dinghuensis]MCP3105178.1 hypothetical protein [Myxococcus dinghuensis]
MASILLRARRYLLVGLAALGSVSTAHAEPGIRILNSLSTADLAFNALTTNSRALESLNRLPLTTDVFAREPTLKNQLEDPAARSVMHYLMGCALGPQDVIEWKSRAGELHVFTGEANLCPEWATGAPTSQCLGYVTACLLARNNAYGTVVEISMRGEDPNEPLRFNPSGDPKAWSPLFLPCDKGGTGVRPECGWVGEGVGACTPGLVVTVGTGGPFPDTCTGTIGTSSGRRVLRVCEDPWGCTARTALAMSDQDRCGGTAPAATFKCPESGQYSLMSAAYDRAALPGTWMRPAVTSGRFPSAAFGAFTFREGAFFGNMFDPKGLNVEVTLNQDTFQPMLSKPGFSGFPYTDVHACFGKDWVAGDVHLEARICANAVVGRDEAHGCLARTVGPCESGSRSSLAPRCRVNDGPQVQGDGDFEGCTDGDGRSQPAPITTFLNSACDALPGGDRQSCGVKCDYSVNPPICKKGCEPRSSSECVALLCQKMPSLCGKK